MISMDKKYRTRDGREVRIYAVDGGGKQPIHGSVKNEDGSWKPISCCSGGTQWGERIKNDYDLIEVKPRIKRTVWLNLYENCHHASTKADADNSAAYDRIACVKVEIDVEEGEGL